tara:strand:+ start:370 stop:879 length:510 start_codon:yes stop_codon:yes gene_type:complete
MANRVLLGNRSTGGYGLYVSKEGQNVLTCADKELLFDSRAHRTGLVYAGATGLNLGDSADNFLTTGSKASLGYPPLVVVSEKNTGERYSSSYENYTDQISHWKTTTSTITPATGQTGTTNNSGVLSGTVPSDGRSYSGISTSQENAFNVSYFVLRIPCAYGYMNSTYFG